jgi:radical SAM superfamily enzyme YgiQ (UPF0313 family)
MKILLFTPPFEAPAKQAASYPLGIAYLGAVLEKAGHKVEAYDFLFDSWSDVKEKIEKIIKKATPDIVGISSMTTNRYSSFELTKMCKKLNEKIKVVLGGVHPTMMYKQILENFPVDYIVIGEGEETFLELVKAIEKKKEQSGNLKKITGIAFRDNNDVTFTGPRCFTKDLDALPFPKHSYFSENIRKNKILYVTSERGCPIGCTFCSTSRHWGRMIRQRKPENVIKEIMEAKKEFPEIKKVYFDDDEFLMRKPWVLEFCRQFKKANLKLEFECAGRVSSIDEDLIIGLKQAGCTRIDFGVESGSPKIIESIKKRITNEQVITAFNLCKKHDISAGIYLMVGLPGETKETVNETICLLRKIPNAKFHIPGVFQVYPGTEIYENLKEKGWINDDYWVSNKPAPFYTFENNKRKLVFWALKIGFFGSLYRGEALKFIISNLKNQMKYDKLKKIVRMYL